MEINTSGSWILNDDNDNGHKFIQKVSDKIIEIIQKEGSKSVYDFGCGYGMYLKDIQSRLNIEGVGFEEYPRTTYYNNIQAKDLSKPFILEDKADLSISLEVGEHIPKEFESIFIDNICNNTESTIVLSWAIPGQDGNGHINCQPNEYIISELELRGFEFSSDLLEFRKDEDLLWFSNTLMLFHRKK